MPVFAWVMLVATVAVIVCPLLIAIYALTESDRKSIDRKPDKTNS